MAVALAYPNALHHRGNIEPQPVPPANAVVHLTRSTVKLLGLSEFTRLNVEPLVQAFSEVRGVPAVARDKALALFDARVFAAWNQLVHELIWQGMGGAGKPATLPLVQSLLSEGTAETAALRAFLFAGVPQPTAHSLAGLRALALAGVWNEYRAAAVIHLLLLTPDYWQRHLS